MCYKVLPSLASPSIAFLARQKISVLVLYVSDQGEGKNGRIRDLTKNKATT